MFITLNASDIQRLSAECRAELMSIMMSPTLGQPDAIDLYPEESFQEFEGDENASPSAADVLDEKVVVDVTVDEARDLIANISVKSLDTLKRFASGKPVVLSSLIGKDGIYDDYSNLKRSFVGAVNRRLRTVSGNRNAVFFSSDRDKTRIRTTTQTALALRCVFNIPEPSPEFWFVSRDGEFLSTSEPQCKALQDRLTNSWATFSGRPNDGSKETWHERVLSHLVHSGLVLFEGNHYLEIGNTKNYEFKKIEHPIDFISMVHSHEYDNVAFTYIGSDEDAKVLCTLVAV